MNTYELMEMASLDAMGLLDPDEREQFERAFRAAAPAVQAQIRRDQLRYTDLDGVLPAVEPPLGLKARVVAAVQQAMQQVAGRKGDVLARIPDVRSAHGVSRFWRTAAIGSMAAALVFGFTTMFATKEVRDISGIMQNSSMQAHLAEFGRQFDQSFFDSNTRFVKFAPAPAADAEPGLRGKATLMFDPVTRKAQLLCKDLPTLNGSYEVVVVDANGNTAQAVLSFNASNAGVVTQSIDALDLENAKSLIIRQQGATSPLLEANGL